MTLTNNTYLQMFFNNHVLMVYYSQITKYGKNELVINLLCVPEYVDLINYISNKNRETKQKRHDK